MSPLIVVAALVEREGHFLVANRPPDSWMEGFWEFPGGKVEEGEEPRTALARELSEELDINVQVRDIEEVLFHCYPDKDVLLLFYWCEISSGEPVPQIDQEVRWVTPDEMKDLPFLPADEPLIDRLVDRSGQP